jgi:nitrogen regulatory protein PII
LKKITLVVKPFKVDAVIGALLGAGATSLTLSEARGYGRQKGHLDLYRHEPTSILFLPKVRIECAVHDDALPAALERAVAAGRTGRIGDGKIWVEDLQ